MSENSRLEEAYQQSLIYQNQKGVFRKQGGVLGGPNELDQQYTRSVQEFNTFMSQFNTGELLVFMSKALRDSRKELEK